MFGVKALFSAAVALFLATTLVVGFAAPPNLAVHFSFAGAANGFMTRGVYLGFILFLGILSAVVVPGMAIAGARRGHRVSGIANSRFWARPENRALFVRRYTDLSLFIGGVLAVIASGVNVLVLLANRDGGFKTAPNPYAALAFVAGLTALCVWASRWFGRRPPGD